MDLLMSLHTKPINLTIKNGNFLFQLDWLYYYES